MLLAYIAIPRGSLPEVFCKKDVLKHFTKFIGKLLCRSLFSHKVAGQLEKRLQHKWFSVNFTRFFKSLIHGQIYLIKFIESNKFDNVQSKNWHIFVSWNQFDQILKKIGRVLFHQINLMQKSQLKLKSPRLKKKLRK